MDKEIDFTLSLCRFLDLDEDKIKSLLSKGFDYPYVLGQLQFNRVGGAAFYSLNKLNLLGKTNREFKNSLRTVYETNVIKSESFKKALDYLSNIFTDVGFQYAFLKGSHLVSLYPLGLRTSNDIDVLINFEDSSKISELLISNGFLQGNIRNGEFIKASRAEIISSQINRGETVPFIKEINLPFMRFLEIDINFSLDFKPEQDKSLVTELLKNTVPEIKTEHGFLNTLSPADFLIQLCLHLYKEATVYSWVVFVRDQALYKYLDIYLFLSTYINDTFTSDLIRKIKEYGVEKECYYALYRANELFPINDKIMVDNILQSIKPDDISYLNKIIDPQSGKIYEYNMNFTEWVFCGKRRDMLHEVET